MERSHNMFIRSIKKYYDLVDAKDAEGLVRLFDIESVYERPGYEALVGLEALLDFFKNRRIIDSGIHDLQLILVQGNTVAAHGTFSGYIKSGEKAEVNIDRFVVRNF